MTKQNEVRSRVRVVARFRPQLSPELKSGGKVCVKTDGKSVLIRMEKEKRDVDFTFDRCFGMDVPQGDVFQHVGIPALEDVMQGVDSTIFAYGQTGSGKTYTMMNLPKRKTEMLGDQFDKRGLGPRVVSELFHMIEDKLSEVDQLEYTVKISYYEIYMEKVLDLLSPVTQCDLEVKEDLRHGGFYVSGLTEIYCQNSSQVMKYIRMGNKRKKKAATSMNRDSSRSHTILSILVTEYDMEKGHHTKSKLNVVDLAGSEKVSRTHASGKQLKEATAINQSLATLGKVIFMLTQKKKANHIPYRESKLTKLLRESLGGTARTTLLINCSPSSINLHETVSTLRFATSAKSIKTKRILIRRTPSASILQKKLKGSQAQLFKLKEDYEKLEAEYLSSQHQKNHSSHLIHLKNLNSLLLNSIKVKEQQIWEAENELQEYEYDIQSVEYREMERYREYENVLEEQKREIEVYRKLCLDMEQHLKLPTEEREKSLENPLLLSMKFQIEQLKKDANALRHRIESMNLIHSNILSEFSRKVSRFQPPSFRKLEKENEHLKNLLAAAFNAGGKMHPLLQQEISKALSSSSTTESPSTVFDSPTKIDAKCYKDYQTAIVRCGTVNLKVQEGEDTDPEWKPRWLVLPNKGNMLKIYKSMKSIKFRTVSLSGAELSHENDTFTLKTVDNLTFLFQSSDANHWHFAISQNVFPNDQSRNSDVNDQDDHSNHQNSLHLNEKMYTEEQ